MDKKSKIFFSVFGLLIVVSVGVTYWRIMIKKDYVIEAQADCDPTMEKCFIWKCDPASDVEGEKCTGDPGKDIWYYQLSRRNAANIPSCDPEKDDTCDLWTCGEGEKDCSVIFCDDANKAEQGVECNDPAQYNIDNPAEEEATACEEGDTECEATACEEGDTECEAAATAEETACEEGDTECAAASEAGDEGTDATETEGSGDSVKAVPTTMTFPLDQKAVSSPTKHSSANNT